MPSVFFNTVQKAQFGAIPFPVEEIEIVGGLRDKIHEPPHQDGGFPELLGRKLYVIRMHAVFDETIADYPNNYPDGLSGLRSLFEAGTIDTLVVPQLGSIQAYCRNWPQKWTAQVRSGETADFEFVENQAATALDVFTTQVPTSKTMQSALTNLDVIQAQTLAIDANLYQKIRSAVLGLIAMRDQADLFGIALEQKVIGVTQLLALADQGITSPLYGNVLEAIKNLWKAALDFKSNAISSASKIATFTTPTQMAASDVARRLYGDASRGMELLQMNAIADAFRIPAGTSLRYLLP